MAVASFPRKRLKIKILIKKLVDLTLNFLWAFFQNSWYEPTMQSLNKGSKLFMLVSFSILSAFGILLSLNLRSSHIDLKCRFTEGQKYSGLKLYNFFSRSGVRINSLWKTGKFPLSNTYTYVKCGFYSSSF